MTLFAPTLTVPTLTVPDEDLAVQGVGTLRWGSAAYMSAPDDQPSNVGWYPRLTGDVTLTQDASDAISVGGMLSLSSGEIILDDADGALADLDRWGTADGRAITIRTIPVVSPAAADYGTPLAGRVLGAWVDLLTGESFTLRTDPQVAFVGLVQRVDRNGDGTATLRTTDVVERLAQPLQPNKYLGSGGVEGGDELKGKPKPVALGAVGNVDPVYLGIVDLGAGIGSLDTYQVHYRAVSSITAVRIRGVAQTLTGGTPGVGQARVFNDLGMFQLGGTPDGAVTADVRGDSVGGYVSSLGGVVKRMVGSLGPQFGIDEIDPLSFGFAEVDLPGEIGWYQGSDDTTCSQVAASMMAACGAVLAGGRAGRLRLFDPLATGIDQFSLGPANILAIEPVDLPASLKPLPREVAMGWRRNWSPLSDVAGSVPAADRERLTSAQSGPARATSPRITDNVAQQRTLSFDGLYWAEADAQARVNKWRNWLATGPRMFRVMTDRYLGQIECGHIGRITYPRWDLSRGVRATVVGWAEQLSAGRLSLTVITQRET